MGTQQKNKNKVIIERLAPFLVLYKPLDSMRDMGKDAYNDISNPNKFFAKDAFGYTLTYYQNDYKPIAYMIWNNVADRFEATTANSQLLAARNNLYNGNISMMVTTIANIDTATSGANTGY